MKKLLAILVCLLLAAAPAFAEPNPTEEELAGKWISYGGFGLMPRLVLHENGQYEVYTLWELGDMTEFGTVSDFGVYTYEPETGALVLDGDPYTYTATLYEAEETIYGDAFSDVVLAEPGDPALVLEAEPIEEEDNQGGLFYRVPVDSPYDLFWPSQYEMTEPTEGWLSEDGPLEWVLFHEDGKVEYMYNGMEYAGEYDMEDDWLVLDTGEDFHCLALSYAPVLLEEDVDYEAYLEGERPEELEAVDLETALENGWNAALDLSTLQVLEIMEDDSALLYHLYNEMEPGVG